MMCCETSVQLCIYVCMTDKEAVHRKHPKDLSITLLLFSSKLPLQHSLHPVTCVKAAVHFQHFNSEGENVAHINHQARPDDRDTIQKLLPP